MGNIDNRQSLKVASMSVNGIQTLKSIRGVFRGGGKGARPPDFEGQLPITAYSQPHLMFVFKSIMAYMAII